MKYKSFLLIKEITALVIVTILSYTSSQISSIVPIYTLILSENINHLEKDPTYNLYLDTKGIGIIFDNSSDINLMPMHLFKQIFKFYYEGYDDSFLRIEILPNGYSEFVIISSLDTFETIHFILKEFGISFPLNELFIPKNLEEHEHEYSFRFLSKEGQEHFIFGSDLIQAMDINFTENNNNFIINNKNFILNVEEN